MSSDPLLPFRPEFPILEKATYLVSDSLSSVAWERWPDQPVLVT
jgi:hypothetical protein